MRITAGMVARCHTLGEPRWSPDGHTIAYLDSFDGRGELMLVPAAGGAPTRVTAEPGCSPGRAYGGGSFAWLPSGDGLVYVTTEGELHRVARTGGPTTAFKGLTGRVSAPAVSPDGRFVACIVSTKQTQDIAVVDLEGEDWPRRTSRGADFTFDPAWSTAGELAWMEWDAPNMPWDSSRIRVWKPDGTLEMVDGADDVSVQQPRFSPDGSRLAYLSDRSGWLNLWVQERATGETRQLVHEEAEHGRPTWGPGSRSYAWSPDSSQIAYLRCRNGFVGMAVVELATGEVREIGPQDGAVASVTWSPAGDQLAIIYSNSSTPPQLGVVDSGPRARAGQFWPLLSGSPAGFATAGIGAPEAITWDTPDGATAHGLFWQQAGTRKPPLIVLVHGGPTGQVDASFRSRTSFWLDRGWAVLQVNYRGSTGYGRAYAQALRERWGVHDVTDTVAGVRALAEQGWVDGGRAVVMGGSAGGFTVLLCLALHPEVFAAGVDLFGVADLFKLAEETHRFEAHYLDTLIGPLPESYDQYVERSPLTVADRICKPLLILQGDKDDVVPPNQSEAILAALQKKGVQAELHVYEGEGHGWQRVSTVMDELERTERFLRQHVLRLAK